MPITQADYRHAQKLALDALKIHRETCERAATMASDAMHIINQLPPDSAARLREISDLLDMIHAAMTYSPAMSHDDELWLKAQDLYYRRVGEKNLKASERQKLSRQRRKWREEYGENSGEEYARTLPARNQNFNLPQQTNETRVVNGVTLYKTISPDGVISWLPKLEDMNKPIGDEGGNIL